MKEGNFKFRRVVEEEDKLDFDNLIPCPHCKKPIPRDATLCLYCGEEVVIKGKTSWVVWIVILFIVLLGLFLLF